MIQTQLVMRQTAQVRLSLRMAELSENLAIFVMLTAAIADCATMIQEYAHASRDMLALTVVLKLQTWQVVQLCRRL